MVPILQVTCICESSVQTNWGWFLSKGGLFPNHGSDQAMSVLWWRLVHRSTYSVTLIPIVTIVIISFGLGRLQAARTALERICFILLATLDSRVIGVDCTHLKQKPLKV
jgi:hypothetical protein